MKDIRKILIANRGEIAGAIITAAAAMGIRTVAVYERPDSGAPWLDLADSRVFIGNGPVRDYLDIEKIIRVARLSGADAVHPGYGFLSENPEFAEACRSAGLIFIGPPPRVLQALGNKAAAKRIAQKAGIPCIPGTGNLVPDGDAVARISGFAFHHGYPVMLKASYGGGGRGIRKINDITQLEAELHHAAKEARRCFSDDSIYAEKYIESPRHIEVQVFADNYGNVIHLGSRDCSIQRRHQKLVQSAPALLDPAALEKMQQAAVRMAQAAGYAGAGTVEFLVDRHTGEFWFMEVNARLQVEHTVTEMITGRDLIKKQIMAARGEPLGIDQQDICFKGQSIQVRINAEDPYNNFRPEGGKTIEALRIPTGSGIRVDSGIRQGSRIPMEYDSCLAKLNVWGRDWPEAVARLRNSLDDFVIAGPRTTIPFYRAICGEPDFIRGVFDTSYIETHPAIFEHREGIRPVRACAG
ncbi:MAG: biotin carboxylase N-terminal domain-containing protein [Syntrophaceae bacterium]